MKPYHKIQSIFKRDSKGQFTDDFSRPEFATLFDIDWVWEEKIDGTNIRVIWDGTNVEFRGRTDRAQIPKPLLDTLQIKFSKDQFQEIFGTNCVVLYGEGFGNKIQKKGKFYLPDSNNFCLFDVVVGGKNYLKREDVREIGDKFGILYAPVVGVGNLYEAIYFMQDVAEGLDRFDSSVAVQKIEAEGLVLRPKVELFGGDGRRVITKLKVSDFRNK